MRRFAKADMVTPEYWERYSLADLLRYVDKMKFSFPTNVRKSELCKLIADETRKIRTTDKPAEKSDTRSIFGDLLDY